MSCATRSAFAPSETDSRTAFAFFAWIEPDNFVSNHAGEVSAIGFSLGYIMLLSMDIMSPLRGFGLEEQDTGFAHCVRCTLCYGYAVASRLLA